MNFLHKSTSVEPYFVHRPLGSITGLLHVRVGALPREFVCTENLTPWMKLLPCGEMVIKTTSYFFKSIVKIVSFAERNLFIPESQVYPGFALLVHRHSLYSRWHKETATDTIYRSRSSSAPWATHTFSSSSTWITRKFSLPVSRTV